MKGGRIGAPLGIDKFEMAAMDMSGMHDHNAMMNMSSTMNSHLGHSGSSTMDPAHGGHGSTMAPGHEGHDPLLHGGPPVDPNSTDLTCQGLMMMYFHTGKCEYVLFEALRTTNVGEMVGACFAIFFVALMYEGLKVIREYLLQRSMVQRYAVEQQFNGSASGDTKVIGTQNPGVHMISAGHFIQTLLHMLQVFISYCLMLVFMTYNAWLCIAVVFGAGVGYFLFGWRKAIVVDINEHCH